MISEKIKNKKTTKRISFDLPVDVYQKLDCKASELTFELGNPVSKKDIVVLALEELFEKEVN